MKRAHETLRNFSELQRRIILEYLSEIPTLYNNLNSKTNFQRFKWSIEDALHQKQLNHVMTMGSGITSQSGLVELFVNQEKVFYIIHLV